ncbi:hypothetical protein BZA05DRAFT_476214 [Tricharina praecox]|uniref:uncharacterized protein n=1 Tax=Tricharina praecox TaxID=43433 RepID=UPI00222081AD|nr:uncharacterized protein BZA05DRAFT_476214 [Tricharina praecox]KAI5846103.1 hypothetical protein BZA05DRAFT_476214 [Tricharina praecox]
MSPKTPHSAVDGGTGALINEEHDDSDSEGLTYQPPTASSAPSGAGAPINEESDSSSDSEDDLDRQMAWLRNNPDSEAADLALEESWLHDDSPSPGPQPEPTVNRIMAAWLLKHSDSEVADLARIEAWLRDDPQSPDTQPEPTAPKSSSRGGPGEGGTVAAHFSEAAALELLFNVSQSQDGASFTGLSALQQAEHWPHSVPETRMSPQVWTAEMEELWGGVDVDGKCGPAAWGDVGYDEPADGGV